MNFLNRPWAFNFIFFLAPVAENGTVLIITDHPERLTVDYSLFSFQITFCLPIKFKNTLKEPFSKEIYFLDAENTLCAQNNYDLIVLDLEKKLSMHNNRKALSELLSKTKSVAMFDWSNTWKQSIRQLFWHLGLFDNTKYPFNNQQSLIENGEHFLLDSYFFVEPNLCKPQYLVKPAFQTSIPLNSNSEIKNFLKKMGSFYLQPHHRILIFKNMQENSIRNRMDWVLNVIGENSKEKPQLKSMIISRTGFLLLEVTAHSENYMLRFPLAQVSLNRLQKQYEILNFLSTHEHIAIPKQIAFKSQINFPYFLEKKIEHSEKLKKLIGKNGSGILNLYEQIFSEIQKIHLQFGNQIKLTNDTFKKYVLPKFDSIRKLSSDSHLLQLLEQFERNLFKELNGKLFLAGICHGDLKIENCIFNEKGQLAGLIDWDMSERDELTLVDIGSLLTNAVRNQLFPRETLREFMEAFSEIPHEFLNAYEQYFSITRTSYINPYVAIAFNWLDRVYKMIQYHPEIDEQWVYKKTYSVLRRMDFFLSPG